MQNGVVYEVVRIDRHTAITRRAKVQLREAIQPDPEVLSPGLSPPAAAPEPKKTAKKTGRKRKNPGRPKRAITQTMCAEVERLAGCGQTMQQIAEYLDMAPSTLYLRQADSPELSEALKRGRAEYARSKFRSFYAP